MATGFQIAQSYCSVFSASPHPLVRNPALSLYPVPHPVTHLSLFPASRAFSFSWGCRAALAPRPSSSLLLLPLSRFYTPTGPPATLWRKPTGSPSIRGPLRAPSTGRSPPTAVPLPCATSRHPSQPIPHVPRFPILLGLLCGPSHTQFSVLSPFPIIPCLYPTGPTATLWRGATGSSSIRAPFRALSTRHFLPAPFCLGGVFLSGPVRGPSSWLHPASPGTGAYCPPGHLVVFFRATPEASPLHCLLLPVPPLPARSVLYALWRCFVVLIFLFLVTPPPLSRCASCLVVLSSLHARTSALHWSSGHGSPRCSSLVPPSS